jgi:hypothetical protein
MASVAVGCDTDVIRAGFSVIPSVLSVHVLFRDNACRITVAVPAKDYALEDRIYDVQYALMDRVPGLRVDLNIVVLGNRKLEEIVTTIGDAIYSKAA